MVRKMHDAARLVASILICFFTGFIGSVFTMPRIATWYARLNKPAFNPPNWVFAPVWNTLFLLMGIALFLVWRQGLKEKNSQDAFAVFMMQLVLNGCWSIVFFGGKSVLGGAIIIALLWLAIALTIVLFWRISRVASLLLIPYILWVSFAGVLNVALLRLNP